MGIRKFGKVDLSKVAAVGDKPYVTIIPWDEVDPMFKIEKKDGVIRAIPLDEVESFVLRVPLTEKMKRELELVEAAGFEWDYAKTIDDEDVIFCKRRNEDGN